MFSPADTWEIVRPFRLQWEESTQEYVLLYPEGIVSLNETAGLILNLCSSGRTYQAIRENLAGEYETDPLDIEEDLQCFLQEAIAHGWIKQQHPGPPGTPMAPTGIDLPMSP